MTRFDETNQDHVNLRRSLACAGYGYAYVDESLLPEFDRLEILSLPRADMVREARNVAESMRTIPSHPCPTEYGMCAVCEGDAWWDGQRWVGDLGLWCG